MAGVPQQVVQRGISNSDPIDCGTPRESITAHYRAVETGNQRDFGKERMINDSDPIDFSSRI